MKYSRMANSFAVSDTGTPPRRTWKRRGASSRSPTRRTSETFGARRTVAREAARGEPVAQCREEGAVVFDDEQSHRSGGRTSSIAEPDSGRKAGPPGSLEAGAFTLSSWKPR